MLVFKYESKKAMKECIGKPLRFIETSMFGPEYHGDGDYVGCNRPHITGYKREFFAQCSVLDGVIVKVK